MSAAPAELVVIGRLSAVYGVKGWLKVYSYTDPIENFLGYSQCWVQRHGSWQPLAIAEGRQHGKGLVVRLDGVEDREQAAAFIGSDVAIAASELPALEPEEFYWRQLVDLQVFVDHPQRGRLNLGRIHHLLETGANDVLVIRGDEHSIDQRERLIPYAPEQFVFDVDLAAKTMRVEWDPDF